MGVPRPSRRQIIAFQHTNLKFHLAREKCLLQLMQLMQTLQTPLDLETRTSFIVCLLILAEAIGVRSASSRKEISQ